MWSAHDPSDPRSTWSTVPGAPGVPATSTTAPAPSPKITAVVRSDGSTMPLKRSAPTTSTESADPARIASRALARAYTKPEHTAPTSCAGTVPRPRRCATHGAVAGHGWSGVVVARTTRSTRSSPAVRSAARPACTAMSPVDVPGSAQRRSRMPVRLVIHASVVTRARSRSALVTTRSGTYAPQPATSAARSDTDGLALELGPRVDRGVVGLGPAQRLVRREHAREVEVRGDRLEPLRDGAAGGERGDPEGVDLVLDHRVGEHTEPLVHGAVPVGDHRELDGQAHERVVPGLRVLLGRHPELRDDLLEERELGRALHRVERRGRGRVDADEHAHRAVDPLVQRRAVGDERVAEVRLVHRALGVAARDEHEDLRAGALLEGLARDGEGEQLAHGLRRAARDPGVVRQREGREGLAGGVGAGDGEAHDGPFVTVGEGSVRG